MKGRYYFLISLGTTREAHWCFFHLTSQLISFLPVSCEADQDLLQSVTSLPSTRDAHSEPHKNHRVPCVTANMGQDRTDALSLCNSAGCSRHFGQGLCCFCSGCRGIFFACAGSSHHSLFGVTSALTSMTQYSCEADGVQMDKLSALSQPARTAGELV